MNSWHCYRESEHWGIDVEAYSLGQLCNVKGHPALGLERYCCTMIGLSVLLSKSSFRVCKAWSQIHTFVRTWVWTPPGLVRDCLRKPQRKTPCVDLQLHTCTHSTHRWNCRLYVSICSSDAVHFYLQNRHQVDLSAGCSLLNHWFRDR